MYFPDYDYSPASAEARKVKIYRNGNSEQCCEMKWTSTTRFYDIKKVLESKMDKNFGSLRLFNQEGVEQSEPDLGYVKDGAILYASKGEEFDAQSSFSEYELLKDLGEGGFGKVVLGVHKVTKQKVAIKIIKTYMIGNAQDIEMVFREAEVLKSLKHKNIVKILNSFTLSNMQVVFIMEYLEGGELLEFLEESGNFTEEVAKNYFRQLVSAIAYCHQHKLIHRDLKLENLLLTAKGAGEIKAIDFGIAGMASNFNPDSADAGSLRYMAPEVLNGQQTKVTPLVDVWAMGIILYGMLFGALPFNGNNNKDIAQRIVEGTYEIPAQFKNKLSSECLDCLSRTLELDPQKRISSVELQYHPWISEEDQFK